MNVSMSPGHNGLVGSALLRNLHAAGFSNVVTADHRDLDLTDGDAVRSFFRRMQPSYVFLAAAKVGGILANSTRPWRIHLREPRH
jgi:GDP-L-fucose synthase